MNKCLYRDTSENFYLYQYVDVSIALDVSQHKYHYSCIAGYGKVNVLFFSKYFKFSYLKYSHL